MGEDNPAEGVDTPVVVVGTPDLQGGTPAEEGDTPGPDQAHRILLGQPYSIGFCKKDNDK